MKIAIAGPYSAENESQKAENLRRLNRAAAEVFKKGHIPLIGVNAALPVLEFLDTKDSYEAIMTISMALVESCDSLLIIAESPGALREKYKLMESGKRIFHTLDEIPMNTI